MISKGQIKASESCIRDAVNLRRRITELRLDVGEETRLLAKVGDLLFQLEQVQDKFVREAGHPNGSWPELKLSTLTASDTLPEFGPENLTTKENKL